MSVAKGIEKTLVGVFATFHWVVTGVIGNKKIKEVRISTLLLK
jgi:hypothetical protein